MRLNAYLEKHDISPYAFAERLNVDRSTVFRWLEGKSMPRKRHLRAIARETRGKVQANDFASDDEVDMAA